MPRCKAGPHVLKRFRHWDVLWASLGGPQHRLVQPNTGSLSANWRCIFACLILKPSNYICCQFRTSKDKERKHSCSAAGFSELLHDTFPNGPSDPETGQRLAQRFGLRLFNRPINRDALVPHPWDEMLSLLVVKSLFVVLEHFAGIAEHQEVGVFITVADILHRLAAVLLLFCRSATIHLTIIRENGSAWKIDQ